MKAIIVFAMALGAAVALSTSQTACFGACKTPSCTSCTQGDYTAMFSQFKAEHKKSYASLDEEAKRFNVFVANMKKAQELAATNPEAMFGATPYADMTAEEFKVYHNGDRYYAERRHELAAGHNAQYGHRYTEAEIKAAPSTMDWRAKGAVTYVKNQGQCGSCWSFSTTGGIEGQWFLAGNKLTALSEQLFVSCDTLDSGCQGGLMNHAYEWVIGSHNGTLVTETSYPYVSGGGSVPACDASKGTFGAKIESHYNIYHSEDQMKSWVAEHGPLSIAVDASAWQMYFGGVMSTCGGSSLDHGVLIVGYDMTASTPYWIIKNSWGGSWGESGYIYVAYGSDQCLLTHYPVTSVVKGSVPPPSPKPSSAYFVHTVYDDQKCSTGAQSFVWEQNTCVQWDGVSFKGSCSSSGLTVTAYYKSLDCTGASTTVHEAVSACTQDNGDFCYYENKCMASKPDNAESGRAAEHFMKLLKKH